MKNKKVKESLKLAVANSVPNVLDNILKKCEEKKGFKSKMIKVTNEEKKRKFITPKLIGCVCGFIILLSFIGVIGLNQYNKEFKVATVIEFDVNPSIELKINDKEEIIEAKALNDDAKKVLEDMDLEKVDLDVAINAIIGSMMKNGYLSIDQNSILVSVKNSDNKESERLQKEIMNEINELLKASSIDGSILTQGYDDDKEIEKLSDDYNISVGKAKLISNVLSSKITNSKGELYTFDALAGLSITELNLLLNDKNTDVTSVDSTGKASDSGYIDRDKAMEIALEDASVNKNNIRELEIEFDADDGILLYEVEFKYNNREYEYDIDAKTGEILYKKNDYDDDYVSNKEVNNSDNNSNNNNFSSTYIGEEKAKSIALNDASVNENNIRELEIELDDERNVVYYEVEFKAGNKEYKYEINAKNGNIIDREIEIDD